MKKPPSMTTILGRTCPHCFSMIDPVWYGWHIGKCPSSKKAVNTLKQDIVSGTPVKNEIADDSQEAVMHVPSTGEALPTDSTPASDSQIAKERVGARLTSIEDNTAQKQELLQLREDNQLLTDTVRSLELKLADLLFQLNLSKEAEMKALYLVESLRDSLKDNNLQADEEGLRIQPMGTSIDELKVQGVIGHLDAGVIEHVGAEVVKDNASCHKYVDAVDLDDCPDHLKEKGDAIDSAKNDDMDKKLDLDRIVDLACGEGSMSQDFISHVDGFIKSKEALPPTEGTYRKQRILQGDLINSSSEDDNQDISEKSGNLDSTKLGVEILANLRNGSSVTNVRHEDVCFVSHTSEPSVIAIDENVHSMVTTPRDVLGTSCVGKTVFNMGCSNSLQADGHRAATVNGDSAVKMRDCSPEAGMSGPAVEKQGSTGLQEADENAQQIKETQSCNVNVVSGAKPGIRRMVLQSDSESESGKIQDNHTSKCECHFCNSKGPSIPALSPVVEKNDKTNAASMAKSTHTLDGIEKKVSQPPSRRNKRLKVVHSSDQSDYVTCEGESEESCHRSAQGPSIVGMDLEGASVDGITDGEHTGVRRSKRLRKKSKNNFQDTPLNEKSISVLQLSSSCADANEECEIFKSDTSASSHSMAFGTHVKRKGPLRTRKRLFEDVESMAIVGKTDSTDSETDDSKIESDGDSLDGFITDSEGRENSQSSGEDHSSNSSYSSSLEAYLNPRHKRDLKIKNYVWELEGEMLSVLAIDLKLCLRAVCALNRRQTEDEQKEKASKYLNKRGFDKLHASRGSRIADFLTDGDPSGPVKKSIEDLEKSDAGALEFCKMLASKHSKQLFEMYTNAEDPHFPFA